MKINLDNQSFYAYTAAHSPTDSKPTVLMVHGTAMDHTVWALQSRYFAYHGYNILALDLPGHGQSDGEPMDTIEAYGSWLCEMMQAADGCCLHLVGHSMGALIVLDAASRYTKAAGNTEKPLQSLSLVGFSYPMTVSPVLMDAAQNRPQEAYAMMTQWSHTSPLGGEPNPGFWSAGSQMSLMSNSQPGAVYTDLTACHHYQGAAEAFAEISCPVLFISGAEDKMAPCKLARKEAERNPDATIDIIPRCGHSIMSESPDGVRDSLYRFINDQ